MGVCVGSWTAVRSGAKPFGMSAEDAAEKNFQKAYEASIAKSLRGQPCPALPGPGLGLGLACHSLAWTPEIFCRDRCAAGAAHRRRALTSRSAAAAGGEASAGSDIPIPGVVGAAPLGRRLFAPRPDRAPPFCGSLAATQCTTERRSLLLASLTAARQVIDTLYATHFRAHRFSQVTAAAFFLHKFLFNSPR
eukprot:SAG11_NODE_1499_length_4787_cov_14.242747_3_plen_192_part_00